MSGAHGQPTEVAQRESQYPVRVSTAELRAELETYLLHRQVAGVSEETMELDKRKVLFFLHWLDTGKLPGRHAG